MSYRRLVFLPVACSLFAGVLTQSRLGHAESLPKKAAAAEAQGAEAHAQKAVRTFIQAMRFGKDSLALKQLNLTAMAERLLPGTWDKFSAGDKERFLADFEAVLAGDSLPRGRDLFRFLDTLAFKDSKVSATEATLPTTIVVHRNLKKTEMVVVWTLQKSGDLWHVVDLTSMGESTLAGIAEEQVKPLLAEGGPEAVLKALHERAQAAQSHRATK